MIGFKERLESLLKQKGITRAELARRLNIPESTIRNWILGRGMTVDSALQLSEFFNVPVDYIANGTDKDKIKDPVISSKEDADTLERLHSLNPELKNAFLKILESVHNTGDKKE